jgi:hypothetical protein
MFFSPSSEPETNFAVHSGERDFTEGRTSWGRLDNVLLSCDAGCTCDG